MPGLFIVPAGSLTGVAERAGFQPAMVLPMGA